MNSPIKKLQSIVEKNLYLPKTEIKKIFGKPNSKSDNDIWFFEESSCLGILKYEIGFIFEEDVVTDIFLTQYLLGREFKNAFYFEDSPTEYKVINVLFNSK